MYFLKQSLIIEEGLYVQCVHISTHDDEALTVEKHATFCRKKSYALHHEICMSNMKKTVSEILKTVMRLRSGKKEYKIGAVFRNWRDAGIIFKAGIWTFYA